jgi:predicted dithiol-disulfide oxidoreductase (DUF899 family)
VRKIINSTYISLDGPGKDIVQYGFGQLSHTMLEHGLLDELRDASLARFRLEDSRPLESGIVGQEPRITDLIWPLWHLLDLTPAGRGDDPDFPALSYPSSRGASA